MPWIFLQNEWIGFLVQIQQNVIELKVELSSRNDLIDLTQFLSLRTAFSANPITSSLMIHTTFIRSLRWLRRFRKRRGYGIHSPAAFQFVTGVVYEKGEYYAEKI